MNIYYEEPTNSFLINQLYKIKDEDEFTIKIQINSAKLADKDIKHDEKNFLEIIFYSDSIGEYEAISKVCTVKSIFDEENRRLIYALFSNYPDVKQISNIRSKQILAELGSLSVNSVMDLKKIATADFIVEILKDLEKALTEDTPSEIKFYIEDLLTHSEEEYEEEDSDLIVADTAQQQKEIENVKTYNYKYFKVTCSGTVDKPKFCKIENLFNNSTTFEINYDDDGKFTFYLNNKYMSEYFRTYDGVKYDPMALFEGEDNEESRQWLKMWMYAINDNLLYPEKMKDAFFDETFKMTEDNISSFHSMKAVDRFDNQIIVVDDDFEPVFLSIKFSKPCHGHSHTYILSLDYEEEKLYMANEYMCENNIMPDAFKTKDDHFIFESFLPFFQEYMDDEKIDSILDPQNDTMKLIYEQL